MLGSAVHAASFMRMLVRYAPQSRFSEAWCRGWLAAIATTPLLLQKVATWSLTTSFR